MTIRFERILEYLGILALLLLVFGLCSFGGGRTWTTYQFLLLGAAGLHAYRLHYSQRLEEALGQAQKLDPNLFQPWPALSGLPLPKELPERNTPLMVIFAYALGAWRFYYPSIAILAIGYLLNTASGSQDWALGGLSLVLVANALDRLYFLSAQVAYFRALTESPEAPFEAELKLRPYVAIQSRMAKWGAICAFVGFLMGFIIPLVALQPFEAASGLSALYLFRKSWRVLTGIRLDMHGFVEWVEICRLERPAPGMR